MEDSSVPEHAGQTARLPGAVRSPRAAALGEPRPMSNLWMATLNSESPRYAEWRLILGGDDVPLYSPADFTALFGKESVRVYRLNVDMLHKEQLDRLINHVAEKFRVYPHEVREAIKKDGFPIRWEDVIVAFSMRA